MVETSKKFPCSEILCLADLMEYMNMGRDTVYSYARLPGFPRLPGKKLRVLRPSLDAWLAAQCNPEE